MTDNGHQVTERVEISGEEAKRRDVICKSIHELVKNESVGTAMNLLGNVMAGIIVTNFPKQTCAAGIELGKGIVSEYAELYYKSKYGLLGA